MASSWIWNDSALARCAAAVVAVEAARCACVRAVRALRLAVFRLRVVAAALPRALRCVAVVLRAVLVLLVLRVVVVLRRVLLLRRRVLPLLLLLLLVDMRVLLRFSVSNLIRSNTVSTEM